jgi:hypothetical protein
MTALSQLECLQLWILSTGKVNGNAVLHCWGFYMICNLVFIFNLNSPQVNVTGEN